MNYPEDFRQMAQKIYPRAVSLHRWIELGEEKQVGRFLKSEAEYAKEYLESPRVAKELIRQTASLRQLDSRVKKMTEKVLAKEELYKRWYRLTHHV